MSRHRAVFLDLHGTLGEQGAIGIREFALYPFAGEAVRLLNTAGLLVLIVTNQSRIARGEMTHQDFLDFVQRLKRQLIEQGGRIEGVYYCPHSEADGCGCRKPQPGLVLQAQQDYQLDLAQCYLVGDVGAWDMQLARAVGCTAILVRTGWGEGSLGAYRHLWAEIEPDYTAKDVLDAAEWIVQNERIHPAKPGCDG